jgi:lipopolysaccharide biosynthesis protein
VSDLAGAEIPVAEKDSPPRLLAFYLPQYHPTAENDTWWGRGFTEWRNVAKARPLFPGHYQPHIPTDLGFYDLRLPEVREAQAQLAREYGIHGFCYYHYWFNGSRPLARPLEEVLRSGRPNFPFCLCWANENWTRRWDGLDEEILIRQDYSEADDLAHIHALLPTMTDSRYIRVAGKPVLLVYKTGLLPNAKRTAEVWRQCAQRDGVDLYLVRVEAFDDGVDPTDIGFDAAVEFAPDWSRTGIPVMHGRLGKIFSSLGIIPKAYTDNTVYEYRAIATHMMNKPVPRYKRFPGVMPAWDNSARRSQGAVIFRGSEPHLYQAWLSAAIRRAMEQFWGDERLVFINAWNEWAEGNHLEPDLKYGRAYLESTARASKEWTAAAGCATARNHWQHSLRRKRDELRPHQA